MLFSYVSFRGRVTIDETYYYYNYNYNYNYNNNRFHQYIVSI